MMAAEDRMHLCVLLSFKLSDGRHECVSACVRIDGTVVRESVPCFGSVTTVARRVGAEIGLYETVKH